MTTLTTNYLTPTGREEAWRFTPLKRLGGLHDGTAVVADRHSLSLKSAAEKGVSFDLISRNGKVSRFTLVVSMQSSIAMPLLNQSL